MFGGTRKLLRVEIGRAMLACLIAGLVLLAAGNAAASTDPGGLGGAIEPVPAVASTDEDRSGHVVDAGGTGPALTPRPGTVRMVSSAAIATPTVLQSPNYRMTAVTTPGWLVTITPDSDRMRVPPRHLAAAAPVSGHVVPVAAVSGATASVSYLASPLAASLRDRTFWQERVCPG